MPKRNKRACIVVPSLYLVIHAEDITYDNNKSCSNEWNPTINFDQHLYLIQSIKMNYWRVIKEFLWSQVLWGIIQGIMILKIFQNILLRHNIHWFKNNVATSFW